MSIVKDYGPLIETGAIEGGGNYEVRGDSHPMVYVYLRIGKGYVEKATHQGELSGAVVAAMLASEIRRAAK
ncbi:hypothetical protein ASG72_02115 [Bosea sp. Leaf344]|uniref:hypothetical protein n=1 Tax=Bosea sp. Leaf344 TaxID=1736346 RepID=UPI0006FF2E38|nr:hypothetical protein [Bosea sp. Leaf344]KQU54457.1 hypothetical protein ASG72_02115 [Bosea sp. Leaf344]